MLSNLTLNGQNITPSVTTGQIGALLQLRDTTLPNVTAELNQFTNNLFNLAQNANLNTANSGTNLTNDANHFFANVNIATGPDNAATIQVNPTLAANASLLYNGTSGVDPTISSSITTALTSNTAFAAAGNFPSGSNTTLSNYGAQIIGQAATAATNATQNNTYQSQLQIADADPAAIRDRRQSRSGARQSHGLSERLWRFGARHLDHPDDVRRAPEHQLVRDKRR